MQDKADCDELSVRIGQLNAQYLYYLPPRKRCVKVAMKQISISRPMTASTAAMADAVSVS